MNAWALLGLLALVVGAGVTVGLATLLLLSGCARPRADWPMRKKGGQWTD
jgi:hypothetical protein